MNIEKAIKNLDHIVDGELGGLHQEFKDSIKLGIEALKAYQKSRANGWYPPGYKLQGETKD